LLGWLTDPAAAQFTVRGFVAPGGGTIPLPMHELPPETWK